MEQNDKDFLITEILNLKRSITDRTKEQEDILTKLKDLQEARDTLETALREIKEKFQEADNLLYEKSTRARKIERSNKLDNIRLKDLQRKLGRIEDTERINERYQQEVELLRSKCLDATWRKENRTDNMGAFPHQIEGAIHFAVTKQGILGDGRGLGKSLTSLIYLDLIEAQKIICLSPSDTMNNYMQEISMWTPHRFPIKIGKMNKIQRDFILSNLKGMAQFVIIINYEAWSRDPELIDHLVKLEADTMLMDESHRGRTLGTSIARGLQRLRFSPNLPCPECSADPKELHLNNKTFRIQCTRCNWSGWATETSSVKNVLEMTGTPIMNKPQELFPQLRLIDVENFTLESNFLDDYCVKDQYTGRWMWRHGADKKIAQIIGPRFLARTRESAGVIIPPIAPITRIITMDELKESYPKQYHAYQQVKEHSQLILDKEQNVAMSMPYFINILLRLRQVLVWPGGIELKIKDEETGENKVVAKLDIQESAKVDEAVELIRDLKEEGERVVLFSQFTTGLEALHNKLRETTDVRSCIYAGGTTERKRIQIQQDFDIKTASKTNYQWDVVLGNYKSMGEGLNLNAANHMILLDRYWNPGGEDQAEGRINRLGTTKDQTLHIIQVGDAEKASIDLWMAQLIESKADIISGFTTNNQLVNKFIQDLKDGNI